MTADEVSPRRGLLAVGRIRDTATFEDIAHRLITDVIAQIGQGTHNAIVTPAAIFLRH